MVFSLFFSFFSCLILFFSCLVLVLLLSLWLMLWM